MVRRAACCLAALCALGTTAAFTAPIVTPAQRLRPAGVFRAPLEAVGVRTSRAARGRAASAAGRRFGLTGLRAEADFYADLGISRSADEKEIKSAFR